MSTDFVSAERTLIAIDTATSQAVVAVGSYDRMVGERTWSAGYRHGETLLASIESMLAELGIERTAIDGVIVGTGPGAFTGLRVGIATAKGLAHGLEVPLIGYGTGAALLDAAAQTDGGDVLLLPAGPSDRVVVRTSQAAQLLPGGNDPALEAGEVLIAVDLDDRAPADAVARGEAARTRLGRSLLRRGATALQAHPSGELATLVPEYVTLPRGAATATGTIEWSRDPR